MRRITIGKFGALTAELARKEAQKIIGQIATGTDPIAEKRSHKVKLVTLGFTAYPAQTGNEIYLVIFLINFSRRSRLPIFERVSSKSCNISGSCISR